MEIKYMIGATAKFWKRYTFPPMTPIEGAPTMDVRLMTKADATAYATKEANEIARERGLPFGKAYHTLLDANPLLKEAVAGIGPALSEHDKLVKKYERSGETEEGARRLAGTDPRAAYRHVDQVAAMKIKQARAQGRTISLAEARQAAIADDPKLAERAGLLAPRGAVPTEGTEQMAAFYHGETVPADVLKRYAAGSGTDETSHADKLRNTVDLVAKRIAADVMFAGEAKPGKRHRDWASAWFAIVSPPPAPTSGGSGASALAD